MLLGEVNDSHVSVAVVIEMVHLGDPGGMTIVMDESGDSQEPADTCCELGVTKSPCFLGIACFAAGR